MADILKYANKNIDDPIIEYDILIGSSIISKKTKNFVIKDLATFVKNSLSSLVVFSAEPIPSYSPVAIVSNKAYKLDPANPLHQFAFAGFSINGTNTGQECQIKQYGEVKLIGWGLVVNQHYLAGTNGTLITDNLSSTNFTKVIGYATDSDTLQIIKDSSTINK